VSRIVVFDLQNRAAGSFNATCNRGWMVYGNPGVDGAGQTTVTVPDSVMSQDWLQLGRLVLIQRPPLPDWAGVIDTPWTATLPGGLTLYNIEYLFSLRSPERGYHFVGSIGSIVREMIRIMNSQEDMFLSLGEDSGAQASFDETLDQRTLWDQLIPILERSGHEMVMRPERIAGQPLRIYADVGVELGIDTGFLLQDNEQGANMKVVSAVVNGKIQNRLMGVSGQSTADQQLVTDVLEDQDSQDLYRTRSATLQFRNITQLTTLNGYTQTSLDQSKQPYIDMTVEAFDVGDTFTHLRPGNKLLARSSKVFLPAGVRGKILSVRILAMALDEEKNTVLMKIRGFI